VKFMVVLIVVTCLEFYPLVIALIDEAIAYAQFPVLSNFETPFEAGRWTNHSHLKTEDRIARNGSKSLRIGITTSKYSGLSLKYFPADWTGYNYFNFSVYNPDSDTLKITCRIHDKNHNNRYADRYNEVFRVIPGWNDYSVPIKKIINTPKERRMDLSNIKLVGLFTVKSPRKRYLYLDDIMLTR